MREVIRNLPEGKKEQGRQNRQGDIRRAPRRALQAEDI